MSCWPINRIRDISSWFASALCNVAHRRCTNWRTDLCCVVTPFVVAIVIVVRPTWYTVIMLFLQTKSPFSRCPIDTIHQRNNKQTKLGRLVGLLNLVHQYRGSCRVSSCHVVTKSKSLICLSERSERSGSACMVNNHTHALNIAHRQQYVFVLLYMFWCTTSQQPTRKSLVWHETPRSRSQRDIIVLVLSELVHHTHLFNSKL